MYYLDGIVRDITNLTKKREELKELLNILEERCIAAEEVCKAVEHMPAREDCPPALKKAVIDWQQLVRKQFRTNGFIKARLDAALQLGREEIKEFVAPEITPISKEEEEQYNIHVTRTETEC